MKKLIALFAVLCLLLAGCSAPKESDAENTVPAGDAASDTAANTDELAAEQENDTAASVGAPTTEQENDTASNADALGEDQKNDVKTILPLPDTTMENLTDAILSVSLEEGDVYVDDNGTMQMDLKIYTYDKYDMVDIANLKVGDTIVTESGEVEVTSLEHSETGAIHINGGLEAEGFDLVTNDSGIFYETGYNDVKNWYEIGEATISVSADFKGIDNADLEQGEVILYPGDFVDGAVTDYNFTPYNTTIRVEVGQIVEMNRVYTP